MICNYIDIQRFIFLWFSQNLIKTPLTEIKCLRIVYADMIFAYLSTFIKPTDYLFLLIYSWNNSQIFVLFALFTHCLRKIENKRLYINVFRWLFTFAFTLQTALLLKNRIFEIKPSDDSLVRSRKSIQTTLCLRKIFHNVMFVVLGEDFSTWLIHSGCSFSLMFCLDWNVRVHSIRSDSVVLFSPKAETHWVSLMSAILSAAN